MHTAILHPCIPGAFTRIAFGAALCAATIVFTSAGAFALSPLNAPCGEVETGFAQQCQAPTSAGRAGAGRAGFYSSSSFDDGSPRGEGDYSGTSDTVRTQFYIEPKHSRRGRKAGGAPGWPGAANGPGLGGGALGAAAHRDIAGPYPAGGRGLGNAPWRFRGKLHHRR